MTTFSFERASSPSPKLAFVCNKNPVPFASPLMMGLNPELQTVWFRLGSFGSRWLPR